MAGWRVAGKAVVRSSNGHQVRVTIDVHRVRARLLGTIELKDLTVPGRLVGLVNQPATAPSEEGSTTQVSLTGRGRTTSGRSLVPASISLTLRVATSQTSDRELVLGRPSRIGALSPGESRSWTLSITRPGSFGLSVGGGESGACPDLEVLDSGGTAIAGLGGCGYTTLVLGAEGTYVFRETAGDSGDMGDSSILVTEPTDAGRLTVGTTVGAPELAPGQYASWKLDGTTGQRIGVAAWSSRAGTSVVLIDPEGNELSSSGATGGDRVAFAELPLTGEYTVQVSNVGDHGTGRRRFCARIFTSQRGDPPGWRVIPFARALTRRDCGLDRSRDCYFGAHAGRRGNWQPVRATSRRSSGEPASDGEQGLRAHHSGACRRGGRRLADRTYEPGCHDRPIRCFRSRRETSDHRYASRRQLVSHTLRPRIGRNRPDSRGRRERSGRHVPHQRGRR